MPGEKKKYEGESLDAQFEVPLAPEPEVDWFDFTEQKEFALLI